MATITAAKRTTKRRSDPLAGVENLAEVLDRLGNVPLERVVFGRRFGSATEKDVLKLLEAPRKRICELIDGILVEKAMGFWESTLASIITHYIWAYLDEFDLGMAFSPDAPIRVKTGRIRFPDTGFISWERIDGEYDEKKWLINVMAELAVEVLSKSNTKKEMDNKLIDYFDAGVRLVWYVDPKTETIAVYTSPEAKTTLTINDTLDGGDVLPGFSLPLKKLFRRMERRTKKKR